MTTKAWVLGALVAAGVVFTMRGGCLQETTKAPDERLVARLDDLCEIARDNATSPERGVRKLGGYMAKHTGDLFADWGNTLAAIEKIQDDARHDARARLARDRIRASVGPCAGTWAKFSDAVERDPKAKALIDQFNVRFNRTLEIIFGKQQQLDLLNLPQLFRA
jgi:hypothetical protein